MGGGSSNAATTLIALNHLWNLNLDRKQLIQLGLSLGADVPVFLYGKSCIAEGIGEIFKPYYIKTSWYCLCIPDIMISTKHVFSNIIYQKQTINYSNVKRENDLLTVSLSLYPKFKEAFEYVSKFGKTQMSGSGSAIFVRCSNINDAKCICKQLPPNFKGFVCRTINYHPLIYFF